MAQLSNKIKEYCKANNVSNVEVLDNITFDGSYHIHYKKVEVILHLVLRIHY